MFSRTLDFVESHHLHFDSSDSGCDASRLGAGIPYEVVVVVVGGVPLLPPLVGRLRWLELGQVGPINGQREREIVVVYNAILPVCIKFWAKLAYSTAVKVFIYMQNASLRK